MWNPQREKWRTRTLSGASPSAFHRLNAAVVAAAAFVSSPPLGVSAPMNHQDAGRKNMKAFETTNKNRVLFTAGIEMCNLFAYRIEIIPTKHQALCISFGHHGSTSSLIGQEGHFP